MKLLKKKWSFRRWRMDMSFKKPIFENICCQVHKYFTLTLMTVMASLLLRVRVMMRPSLVCLYWAFSLPD